MSKITSVEVFPVAVPVTRAFKFASGSAGVPGEMVRLVLVRLTDSEGVHGWGEGRAQPAWSYETPDSVVSTIRHYLAPAIAGIDVWDRRGLHARMHAVVGRGPSTGMPVAKAAVDLAFHDLCARRAGVPLRAFLGGSPGPAHFELSWTVTATDSVAVAEDVAKGREIGMRHFNFKAGVGGEVSSDAAIAKAVRGGAPQGAFVWADANQGLSLPKAARLAEIFRAEGVDVLEQPLAADARHLMRELRRRTSLPLAVDEASVSASDFFAHTADNLVDWLVLKLTRSGGILPSLDQAAVARAAGLGVLVSGLTDGMLVKLAACQTALACGSNEPAALNGTQFMDDSELFPNKAQFERDGNVLFNDEVGIGIEPDPGALKKLAWEEK